MYIYLNPRTGKMVMLSDFRQDVEQALMPNKHDILVAYSSYSNAVKLYHWAQNPTDEWFVECVLEVPLKITSLNEII